MEAADISFVVTGVAVVLQSLFKVSCLGVSVVFFSLRVPAVVTLIVNPYVVVEGVTVVTRGVAFSSRQLLQRG